MLEVRNLYCAYSEKRKILEHISFKIEKGETAVLSGPSGSGKTTLCYCLCGIIPHVLKARQKGEIIFQSKSVRELSVPEIATKIGMVFQNPEYQMVAQTVEDELAFGLENLCTAPEAIRIAVDEYLNFFHLQELRYKNPARLSGGQKQIVSIAAAAVMQPKLLILDEPMSHLDEDGQELVRQAMKDLKNKEVSLLVVEHEPERLKFIDRQFWLENGVLECL